MRSFWFDPYLWVHLAGIAAVPLLLELCLLGLASGEPLFPVWFELLFVGAIGILPILWMQWQRPFSIFSLVILALKPSQLTEDQRRILQRFKLPVHRILAVLSAVGMVWVLWQLYQIAPAVAPTPFPGLSRTTALLIAAIAFLGSNLFLQVPVSVLSVLLISDNTFAATPAYPPERITQDFTIPGIRVAKILPPLVRRVAPIAAAVPPETPTVAPPPARTATSAPVAPASIPATEPKTEAATVEPPFTAVEQEPEQMTNQEADREHQALAFDDREAQIAEIEPEIEAIIAEEAEIAETIARDEIAAIDPIETQTREAVNAGELENEAVEAIAPSPAPVIDPAPTQSVQLSESSDLVEEIVIPPEQSVAIEPEFTPSESADSESVVSRQTEENIEDNEEIHASSDRTPLDRATVDVIAPQSPQTVEPVETITIVEDSTIVETFAEETVTGNDSETEEVQTNQPQAETEPAESNAEESNTENSNLEKANLEKANETESQQGVDRLDPWQ